MNYQQYHVTRNRMTYKDFQTLVLRWNKYCKLQNRPEDIIFEIMHRDPEHLRIWFEHGELEDRMEDFISNCYKHNLLEGILECVFLKI